MNVRDQQNEHIGQAAIRFAKAGADVVMQYFQNDVRIAEKGSGNLVSEADLNSEQEIVELIRREYPEHAVLAEESHSDTASASKLWIVDPLDGTNNFAHGIPHFAISIAFYEMGQPQCAVVFNPARNDLFSATRGGGACWNDHAIRVSNEPCLEQTLVGTGFYYDRGEMMRRTLRSIEALFGEGVHGIRRFGTASLDLCSVASAQFGGFFEFELAPWDFAAGRLIVEEAGGKVTDAHGETLQTRPSSVVATNGLVHSQLLNCLENVGKGAAS